MKDILKMALNQSSCMPQSALICLIVPYYFGADIISRALNSILAQTYSNYVVYVVNDSGSDAGFSEIMEKYSQYSQLKFIERFSNTRAPKARFEALKISTEDLIIFLDQDDFLPVDRLEKTAQLYKNSKFDVLCAQSSNYFETDGRIVQSGIRGIEGNSYIFNTLKTLINAPSKLGATTFNRTKLVEVFDPKISGGGEEWVLFHRLVRSGAAFKTTKDIFLFKSVSGKNESTVNRVTRIANMHLLIRDELSDRPYLLLIYLFMIGMRHFKKLLRKKFCHWIRKIN